MCSCSYGDKMRVGITSKILSHNIQRNFLRILKEEGIHVTEQENDFPGYQEKKLGLMQKSMQIFTFLCIAAVVISWVVNLMLPSGFLWAGFVSGGVLCTWLFVMVGYKKRRNLLKMECGSFCSYRQRGFCGTFLPDGMDGQWILYSRLHRWSFLQQ